MMSKKIIFVAFLFTILSVSCDKIKEVTEIDFKTNIEADIPVTSQKVANDV